MSHYLDFIDFKYKPSQDDLICLFRFEPAKGISIKEAIGRIAAESSNGTWSKVEFGEKEHIKKIRARAFELKGNYVKVAYPIELFELGSIPQLLSSVAGNIFGMKALNNLRLEDIQFSKKYIKAFKGPQFGIEEIRKVMRVKDRPLTATVPKPKLGMNIKEYCATAYNVWSGGVDFIKTDENMTSQRFINFYKNTEKVLKIRKKVERETGERKEFLANVTAETKEMIKRTRHVYNNEGKFVMIDVLTAGFAGFQTLREECQDLGIAIHIHRAFHSLFTRNPKHGMSMLSLGKLVRLVGGDTLHIGTIVGKLVGGKDEVISIEREVENEIDEHFKTKQHVLNQKWYNIKPVMATSSGGLHPGLVPYIIKVLGKDILIQAGGGVLGNPLGAKAGAMALRQSIYASLNNIPLNEYAKQNKELKAALETWGTERPV